MKSKAMLEKEFLEADKLWKIWKIALTDLRLAERNKYCTINMRCWLGRDTPRSKYCNVCAAGSVILRRLNIAGLSRVFPTDFSNCEDKLRAINELRNGDISAAAREIGAYYINREYGQMNVCEYNDDKKRFWKGAKALLKYLKKNDL